MNIQHILNHTSLIRGICLMVFLMSGQAKAETEVVDGITWTYTIKNGGAYVGGGGFAISRSAAKGAITIPSKLGGHTVTDISDAAFYAFIDLTSITIPNTVESIGRSAFVGCGLTSVTIPPSVYAIGGSAFAKCRSLTEVNIQSTSLWTEDSVFWCCTALKSVAIPASMTTIARSTFDGCSSLESVTIANGVKTIDASAFYCCSALKNIEIPASVSSIGSGAFYGCSALSSITVDAKNSYFTSIDGVLYDKNVTKIIVLPMAKSGVYEIPDTITTIADYAMSGYAAITSVKVPDSVVSIGSYAFLRCSSLTNVVIPASVTSIGSGAFSCSALKHVVVPEKVQRINYHTFAGCDQLESVSLPAGLTEIGMESFMDCESLKSIEIPNNVSLIEEDAFLDCRSLSTVTLPAKLTDIPLATFAYCESLTKIAIPPLVTNIYVSAFSNCGKLESIQIPDSVTEIGDCAFKDCVSLKKVDVIGCNTDRIRTLMANSNSGLDMETITFYDDSIPEIDEDAPIAVFADILGGLRDARPAKYITNYKAYDAYRNWAAKVKNADGNTVGSAAVTNSPHAWLSYALDSATLLAKTPMQGDVDVAAFEKNATTGKFDLSVSIDGVTVGTGATAENLATLFGVEGCKTIDGEYSSENVAFTFGTPIDGKVKISAAPKDATTQFFLKVKMTP